MFTSDMRPLCAMFVCNAIRVVGERKAFMASLFDDCVAVFVDVVKRRLLQQKMSLLGAVRKDNVNCTRYKRIRNVILDFVNYPGGIHDVASD